MCFEISFLGTPVAVALWLVASAAIAARLIALWPRQEAIDHDDARRHALTAVFCFLAVLLYAVGVVDADRNGCEGRHHVAVVLVAPIAIPTLLFASGYAATQALLLKRDND